MKQPRVSRRQQRELQRIYAAFFSDTQEFSPQHLDYLRLRHQHVIRFS